MRAANNNTKNRFLKNHFQPEFHDEESYLDHQELLRKTELIPLHPKSIVNKVKSPDVGMEYSLNPYQGCEHGCAYCYARPTHEYWGYSAGHDFEQKILVKHNAPELLEKLLNDKKWQAKTISLSGNTDCYQPAERQLKITRSLLQLFLKYRHPVGIITKNALILRDLDLLKALAEQNLVSVAISITTLNENLRRKLEPRTASVKNRLDTIKQLADNNIPVMAMMAPIIPSLNSHEILPLAKKVAEMGAYNIGYTMVRLNDAVEEVFTQWIQENYPDRAQRVLNQIKSTHGGSTADSRFGTRMKGEGNIAQLVKDQFEMARKKYGLDRKTKPLDTTLFISGGGQLSLF